MTPDWQSETPNGEELRARNEAVERCRDEGRRVSVPTAKGDSYAYPEEPAVISWGINGGSRGFLICRGTVPR